MAESTDVVFRKFAKGGDIIALFPELPAGHRGNVTCYQHVGQHGAADYSTVIDMSYPAKPTEYAALHAELIAIGYVLDVRTRSRR